MKAYAWLYVTPHSPRGRSPATFWFATFLVGVLGSGIARSQASAECHPPCREGFFCQAGHCVSECNPPCTADQVCVEGRRCDLIGSHVTGPAAIYEPPPPPLPRTKPFDAQAFSLLGFHLGFAGNVSQNGVSGGLDSTLGANIRSDFPVARYVLIGPMLQFGSWRPEYAASHNYDFDLDLVLRARIPIELGDNHAQAWAGLPIGFSVNFLGGSNDPNLSDYGWGWNIGCLLGGAYHWPSGFGLFAELGWLQHKVSHSRDAGPSLDYRLAQWIMNVGFAFKN